MAINDSDVSNIISRTTSTTTTEAAFRDALEDTITQVNTNQVHMDASRTYTLTGDVTGSTSGIELNETGDYTVSIATTFAANSITNNEIADDAITADKLTDETLDNSKIVDNTITTDKINSGSKESLIIANTSGTALKTFTTLVGS